MGKFRRITNIIDAVKWTGRVEDIESIKWIAEAIKKQTILFAVNEEKDNNDLCLIDRDYEIERVNKCDYILKEGKEIYMMSEKAFEESYEQVGCYKHNLVVKIELDQKLIEMQCKEAIEKFKKECKRIKRNA